MATTTNSNKSTTKKTTSKTTKKPSTKAKVTKKPSAKKLTAPASSNASVKKSIKATSSASTSSNSVSKKDTKKTKISKVLNVFQKLNRWNYALAALHAIQGAAILVLSRSDSLFPVTTSYITVDSLASTEGAPVLVQATRTIFDFNLAYIVAAFFFMSAIAHLIIATFYRKRYEINLQKGINKVRWYEYGISASTMMIGIAALSGVADLSTLVLIFGTTLVMNLCGLIMEIQNQGSPRTSWISFKVGTISGLLPWIVIAIYFIGANVYGLGNIPTFVYAIYGSLFLFFSSFAVNMYLQYKGKGKWSDYLFGEKVYMVLSLVAKSALAWQIFAGTLRP